MKASDYLNKKYNLLKRGHEHECYCGPCQEFDEFERLIKKLEAKAAKWDDPQTQADLELAAAVKLAFKKKGAVEIPCGGGNYEILYQEFELLDWYREQKDGAE